MTCLIDYIIHVSSNISYYNLTLFSNSKPSATDLSSIQPVMTPWGAQHSSYWRKSRVLSIRDFTSTWSTSSPGPGRLLWSSLAHSRMVVARSVACCSAGKEVLEVDVIYVLKYLIPQVYVIIVTLSWSFFSPGASDGLLCVLHKLIYFSSS